MDPLLLATKSPNEKTAEHREGVLWRCQQRPTEGVSFRKDGHAFFDARLKPLGHQMMAVLWTKVL